MAAEALRSLSVRGKRFTAPLAQAVRDLPAGAILWEITADGFVPLAHRHLTSLSLSPLRLTAKEIRSCTA